MPKHNTPLILVIEDEEMFHDIWTRRLAGKAVLMFATTIEGAQSLFVEISGVINIVALDACVPTKEVIGTVPILVRERISEPNTMDLIMFIRTGGFHGPIVAISGNDAFNVTLVDNGCTHSTPKRDFVDAMLKIIDELNKPDTPKE